MKKKLRKHIQDKHFIKVYLSDNEGFTLTHFEGFLLDQNDKYIFMSDVRDFNYDGFVVARKADISEIKNSDNERFFDGILEKEGIKAAILKKASELNFTLSDFESMFQQLHKQNQAIIIECLYENDTKFQLGPVIKTNKKRVFIDYINAKGEFDLKPVSSKYKEITFFRVDSPYANLFYKYAKRID